VGVIALITSCGDEYRRERLDPPRSWVASECLGLRSVIRVRRPRRGMSLGAALTNSAQMLVGRRRGRHPGFEQCKGRRVWTLELSLVSGRLPWLGFRRVLASMVVAVAVFVAVVVVLLGADAFSRSNFVLCLFDLVQDPP
jgi:hypothetical protein